MSEHSAQDGRWHKAKPVALIKDKGAVLARVAGKTDRPV